MNFWQLVNDFDNNTYRNHNEENRISLPKAIPPLLEMRTVDRGRWTIKEDAIDRDSS
jgi:hypothetical protein